jgi:CubicO group peptidase (beta-lactamase class C family)
MIAMAFVSGVGTMAASAKETPGAAGDQSAAEAAERAVIVAINGNEADRATLVKGNFASNAFASVEEANEELSWLDRLALSSRGLNLVSLTSQNDRMAEAIVHTNRGNKFGKLILFTSSKEPGKISNLFLLPARDPAKVKREAWPAGKLTPGRIAAEIEKRAATLAAEDNFSGVILVAKSDRIIVRRAYGFADREWRIPNRIDTRFHVGSIGKTFTAAAVLKLADQGKLSLDDTVAKWVPEYPHPDAAQITLRHLLTHTSGIGDMDIREIKRPMTGAAVAATMIRPLVSKPGERFGYSNAGYVLLQAVIERATDMPFGDALRRLIFDPSGMARTGTWPVTAIVSKRATGYLHPEDDPLGLGQRFSNEQFLGYGADGSGGEYSTADDMFVFLRAIATGKLLGPTMTQDMLMPRVDFAGAPRASKYGYGMDLTTCAGHPIFGHEGGGQSSGVSSLAYRTLDSGWSIIVLSNYDPPAAGDLAMSICEFVAAR